MSEMQHSDLCKKNSSPVVLSLEYRIQQNRLSQNANRKAQRNGMFLNNRNISDNSTPEQDCVKQDISARTTTVGPASSIEENYNIETPVVPQAEDNVSTYVDITNAAIQSTKKSLKGCRQEQFESRFLKLKEHKTERVEQAQKVYNNRPPFIPADRTTNSLLSQAVKTEVESKSSTHRNLQEKLQESVYEVVSTPPNKKSTEVKIKKPFIVRKTLPKLHSISEGASTASITRTTLKSNRLVKGPFNTSSATAYCLNTANRKLKRNTLSSGTEEAHGIKAPVNVSNVTSDEVLVTSTKMKPLPISEISSGFEISHIPKLQPQYSIQSLTNCSLIQNDQKTDDKNKTTFNILHESDSIIPPQPGVLDQRSKASLGMKDRLEYVCSFLKKVSGEIARLRALCDLWATYNLENLLKVRESGNDSKITVLIDETKLLLKRMVFRINKFVVHDIREDSKRIIIENLEDFCSQTLMKINDVDERFKDLERWKANNWVNPDTVIIETKKHLSKVSNTTFKSIIKSKTYERPSDSLQQPLYSLQTVMQPIRSDFICANTSVMNGVAAANGNLTLAASNLAPQSSTDSASIIVKQLNFGVKTPSKLSTRATSPPIQVKQTPNSNVPDLLANVLQSQKNGSNIFKNCELLNMPLLGPSQQESSSMVALHKSTNISYDRKPILKTSESERLIKGPISITISTASSPRPANLKLERNTLFRGTEDAPEINTPVSVKNLNPYEEVVISTKNKSIPIPQIVSGFEISSIDNLQLQYPIQSLANSSLLQDDQKTGGETKTNFNNSRETDSINVPQPEVEMDQKAKTSLGTKDTLKYVGFFRKHITDEFVRLRALCDFWDSYKKNILHLRETGIIGKINVVIYETKKYIKTISLYFDELRIDYCGENAQSIITILEGSWLKMLVKINDIDARFSDLERWRANKYCDAEAGGDAPTKDLSKVNKAKVRYTRRRYRKPTDMLRQLLQKLHAKKCKLNAALLITKDTDSSSESSSE